MTSKHSSKAKFQFLVITLIIFVDAILAYGVLQIYGTRRDHAWLIINFPVEYSYSERHRLIDAGIVEAQLPLGRNLLKFQRKGKNVYALLDVLSTGQVYRTFRQENLSAEILSISVQRKQVDKEKLF